MATPTADVSDAATYPGLQSCPLQLRLYGATTACEGTARTVQVRDDSLLVKQLITEPGAGRVLVVDGAESDRVALFGEQSALTALAHGWEGVVIAGRVRDSAILQGLSLHVKALGVCPVRSGKRGDGRVGVPVRLGSVEIRDGDRIWSDDDGLLVAPGPAAPADAVV